MSCGKPFNYCSVTFFFRRFLFQIGRRERPHSPDDPEGEEEDEDSLLRGPLARERKEGGEMEEVGVESIKYLFGG